MTTKPESWLLFVGKNMAQSVATDGTMDEALTPFKASREAMEVEAMRRALLTEPHLGIRFYCRNVKGTYLLAFDRSAIE